MKKFVLWYLAILAVLDLGWAIVVSHFGGALFSAGGRIGGLGAADATDLGNAGGVLLFFVALFQSLVFDGILTVALFIVVVILSMLRSSK